VDDYVEQTENVENILAFLGVRETYHVHWELSPVFQKLAYMSDGES